MNRTSRGFTLIELLVVMSILSLLVVALLPMLAEGQMKANQTADSANLRWHHMMIRNYKDRYGYYPKGGGSKFILGPWIRGVCQKTKENRDRYFSPAVRASDERWIELKDTELKDHWQRLEDITSEDTNYAGRASAHKRTMTQAEEAWMASDNEHEINHYEDGSIMVLMQNAAVRTLLRDPDLLKYGWPENLDGKEYVYPVGPESEHPILRKLEK